MFKKIFLNNYFILGIISLNAGVIFLQGFFDPMSVTSRQLEIVDHIFTFLFVIEAAVKISHWGFGTYIKDRWNVFDFTLVLIALPSIIAFFLPINLVSFEFLLTLRVLRVFKFFRVLKFIPRVEELILGVLRAARASLLIVFAFFIFNFIFAILSFSFFSDIAPEYFSNPLIAFYSTFKIFTIEGWYEIPDLIAERSVSDGFAVFARVYFILLLFGGGIFGLSLINSIFVDTMMSDNSDELVQKMNEMESKLDKVIEANNNK
jgi:voltage-gated sodium channel